MNDEKLVKKKTPNYLNIVIAIFIFYLIFTPLVINLRSDFISIKNSETKLNDKVIIHFTLFIVSISILL